MLANLSVSFRSSRDDGSNSCKMGGHDRRLNWLLLNYFIEQLLEGGQTESCVMCGSRSCKSYPALSDIFKDRSAHLGCHDRQMICKSHFSEDSHVSNNLKQIVVAQDTRELIACAEACSSEETIETASESRALDQSTHCWYCCPAWPHRSHCVCLGRTYAHATRSNSCIKAMKLPTRFSCQIPAVQPSSRRLPLKTGAARWPAHLAVYETPRFVDNVQGVYQRHPASLHAALLQTAQATVAEHARSTQLRAPQPPHHSCAKAADLY